MRYLSSTPISCETCGWVHNCPLNHCFGCNHNIKGESVKRVKAVLIYDEKPYKRIKVVGSDGRGYEGGA